MAVPGIIDITTAPYNAAGNGIADDGPALQAALDAIPDNYKGGATIVIPEGRYRIATPVSKVYGGTTVRIVGVGPSTQIYFDCTQYQDGLVINNSPEGGRCGLENMAIIGPQVLGNPITAPHCYRAVVLGGTYGGSYMRRVVFAGVYAKGAVAYMGNGAAHGIIEHCDFIGCTALGDTGYDVQSLLELNILFATAVRNCRLVRTGYHGDVALGPGSSRQAIRIRHYDLPDGQYNNSQVSIDSCSIDSAGDAGISTLERDGNPNGPTSSMQYLGGGVYDAAFPSGIGRWQKVTGTPTGGFTMGYTFEIRIDGSGAPGVATWSTRYENAGFGGGFTAWTSQGAASAATVNGMTFTMKPADNFTAGSQYRCYVVGSTTPRMRQIEILRCKVNTAPIVLSQVDRVLIQQLDYDNSTPAQTAIDLYDCNTVRIVQPYINTHKIIAEPAAFGFAATVNVLLEEPNDEAHFQGLRYATNVVIRKNGIYTRLRPSMSSFPANTLVKAGSVDGAVGPCGTTDNGAIGVTLDRATGMSQMIRIAELYGQQVSVHTDRAQGISPGDPLYRATGATGLVMKAATGYAFMRSLSTLASGVSGTVEAIWGKEAL